MTDNVLVLVVPGPVSDVVFQTSTNSVRLVWGDIPQDGCLDYLKVSLVVCT